MQTKWRPKTIKTWRHAVFQPLPQNNLPTMLKHEKIFFLFLGFKKQYHNDAFYTHPIL